MQKLHDRVLVSCMHALNIQSTWLVLKVLVITFASNSNGCLWIWCYNNVCLCVEPWIKQHLFLPKCALWSNLWSFHYGAAVKRIRCRFSLHNFWSIHCYWPAVLVSTASYHRVIPEDSEWYHRWITIYHTKMLVDLLHSYNFLPINKLQMLIKEPVAMQFKTDSTKCI